MMAERKQKNKKLKKQNKEKHIFKRYFHNGYFYTWIKNYTSNF